VPLHRSSATSARLSSLGLGPHGSLSLYFRHHHRWLPTSCVLFGQRGRPLRSLVWSSDSYSLGSLLYPPGTSGAQVWSFSSFIRWRGRELPSRVTVPLCPTSPCSNQGWWFGLELSPSCVKAPSSLEFITREACTARNDCRIPRAQYLDRAARGKLNHRARCKTCHPFHLHQIQYSVLRKNDTYRNCRWLRC